MRIPNPIWDVITERAKALGMDDVAPYFLSLTRYDLLINKPHDCTGDFHRLPRAEQDKIDDEIARAYKAGESLGGTWFAHRVKAACEEFGIEIPPMSSVAEKLAAKLKKGKKNDTGTKD